MQTPAAGRPGRAHAHGGRTRDGNGTDVRKAGGQGSVRVPSNAPVRWRPNYAAIDLGTNNCRLLIARPSADGFTIVDAFSRIVRLGEGLRHSGRISDAAMDRAVAALSICSDKLRRRHVTLSRAVATEACRQASNGRTLIERIHRETGIALDIISPGEEAKLAVMGCQALLEPGDGPALVFDIGGGSTEVVHIEGDGDNVRIVDWVSVPWGVVSLTEHMGAVAGKRSGRIAAYAAMRSLMDDSFAAFAARVATRNGGALRLLGTSGTVTTLASVHLELPRYDRRAVDGLIVPADAMRAISQDLAQKSMDERIAMACIGTERADLVVAGCAILESIIDFWPAAKIGVADRGIREGILRGLVGYDRAPDPVRQPRGVRA